MAEIARLSVALEGDTSDFESALSAVERGMNKAASVAVSSGGAMGGIFHTAGAGAVAMGNLIATGVTTAAGALMGLGQSALSAVVDFEKMQAQMTAMTAVELVDTGKFADFNAAYDTAVVKSKELLDWSQKLAVVSPYEGADVARVSAAAQAFGFLTTQFKTAEEAQRAGVITVQRLTEGILNFGAATGKAGSSLDNISMIAGQIKAMGKLQGGDSMQLKNLGINLEGDIAAKLGITTAAVVEMREKGLIPADLALNTLMANLERYGSAAEKQGNSLGGLMASLSDLATIAQRDLFGGIFRSLQPKIAEAVTTLQDPAFKQALVGIGESAGAAVTQALDALGRLATGAQAAFAAFQAGMATAGVGGGVFNVLTMLGVDENTAANVGAVLNGIVSAVQTGVQAVQAAIAGFQSGGLAGGAGAFLTSLGLDAALVSHVQTVLGQIGAAIQTGINALRAAVAGFASGGIAGGAGAFLAALGIDPSVVAQAQAVLGQVASTIQAGVSMVVGVVAAAAGLVMQHWQAVVGALAGVGAVVAGLMAFQGVAGVLGAVGAALTLLLSPIGLLVAAAALIGAAWATNFGNIQGIVGGLVAAIGPLAALVGGVLVGAFQVLGGAVGFVTQHWQIFASILGAVGAALAGGAILGSIMSLVGGIQFLIGVVGGIGAVVASAGGVMGLLATFMAMPIVPIGLLAAAIGFLAVAWLTNMGSIQEKTAVYIQQVIANWQQLVGYIGAIQQFLSAPITEIGSAWGQLTADIGQVNADFQSNLNGIATAAADTSNSASSSFETMAGNASTMGRLVQAVTTGNFGAIPGIVGGAMSAANDNLSGAVSAMVANVTNGANIIKGTLASISAAAQAVGGVALDASFGPALDQGQISGRTDPAAIAQKNAEFAQKTVQLAESYKPIQAAFNKVSAGNAAAGAAATGAGAAAKSAEDKIKAANDALQSTIQTVTDLNEMLKSGLSGLTVGEGADQIVQLASQVAQVGRRMYDAFSVAAAGLTEDSGKAASALGQGIGTAAQGLSSVIGLLPKLWEFMNSPEWGEMQGNMGAVIAMAAQLSSIGRQIYDVFSAAASGVSEESAKAAQAAAAGIGAAAQALTAIVGLLPKLWEFINDPAWDEIQAAQGQVVEAAAQLSQLGVAIFNAFSAASGGISEESSKAAQAAAAGIQAATGAISSIIDAVKKIVDFTADVGYAAFIFTEEGRGHVMAAASALISLGVEMFNQFAAAASGISAKAVASAKRLGEGLDSMNKGLTASVESVVRLSSFMADGMNNIHVNNEESRGALITMAGLLASLGKLMLDQFALAASQVSSLAVAAAKRLSEGLQAVTTGISSVIDAVAKMSSFMADGMNNVHMNSEDSRNALITMAHFLANVGREIYNQFVVVSVSVAQLHVDAAKRLAEGVKAASDAMTATMGLVTAMSAFMANTALAAMVAPGEARQALYVLAIHLSEVAREIYNQFVNASVLVSQYHVDAAKRLAEGVQAATSALTATLDLVERLMTATTSTALAAAVAPGPLRDALFALVQNLSIFAREVYNQWVAAAVLVSQYHVEAARRLADGAAAAMQAVGSAMDMLGSLFRFAGDKVMMAIVQSIGARQWFARLAASLGQFVEDVLEAFDTFHVGVAQDLVDNAARLGAGAEAASQIINASIGALASLFKFAGDAVMMSIIQSAGARTWFANLGAAIGQFVEDVLEAFNAFDVGITQDVVDRAERLGQGADAANQILTGAVGALTSLFKFASDAAMVAVVSSQSSRESYARLGAALGQFVEDALEAFDTFDVSVTQAMVDQAAQLGAGAAAIQSVVDGVLGIIEKLTDQNFPSLEGGAMTVILDRLEDVFGAGKQIADRATTITKEWTVTVMPVVATLGTVLGGTLDLVSRTLGLISELGGSNFPDLGAKAMSTILDRLERLLEAGKKIADKATTIAKSWGAEVNPVIATVGTVIGNGLDVVSKTLNIVGELGGNRFPDLGAKAMSTILDRLEQLLGAGKKIADRATTVAKEWTATVSPVMTTVGNVLSAGLDLVSRTLDIVGQLGGEKFPDLSDGAVGVILARLEDLLKAGKQIAEKALSVALNWTATVNPVMETVGKILDNGLGLVSTTLDIVGQLTGDKFPDLSDGAIAIILIRLEDLLKAGKRIADRALLVATGWTATVNPVMETVGKILSDGLDIVAKTLDIVGQLAGDKFPALDDEAMSIILTRLEDLLKAGKQIAERALAVATGWTSLVNPVMATVGKVLADGLDIVSKTLDIVGQLKGDKFPALDDGAMTVILARLEDVLKAGKQIADKAILVATGWTSTVNPAMATVGNILSAGLDLVSTTLDIVGQLKGDKFPALDDGAVGVILARLESLLSAGYRIATEAIRIATGWTATVNPAMVTVGRILSDSLDIIGSTLDIQGLLGGTKFPSFDDAAMATIKERLAAVLTGGKAIADEATRLATGWQATVNPAMEVVGKILGDGIDIISSVLDFSELQSKLVSFRGIDMAIIGPKIDLVFAAAIAIAEQFGRKAESSGVTQAFSDAAEKVSKVLDGAFGALNGTLDLGKRLLDPETQIPSVGQVQGKLNAAFAFISATLAQMNTLVTTLPASVDFAKIETATSAAQSAFDSIMAAVDTIAALRTTHIGMTDFDEIRTFLANMFSVFDGFSADASGVNAVVAAVSSILGGLANMVSAQSYQAGVSIGQSIAAGIAAGLTGATGNIGAAVVEAVTGNQGGGRGMGTPSVSPGGGGGATTSQTVYNAPQNYAPTFISITNTNPAIAADVTNQAILLKSQFGAGL